MKTKKIYIGGTWHAKPLFGFTLSWVGKTFAGVHFTLFGDDTAGGSYIYTETTEPGQPAPGSPTPGQTE